MTSTRTPAARSMRERAYDHTQRKIVNGDLAPGAVVSEVALAKELGSSRTPVREALGQLCAEGFLEQIPQRGTVVVQLRREDIVELYELREALETYAVGKAARQGLSPADHVQLAELVRQFRDLQGELETSGGPTLGPEEMRKLLGADLSFHILLLRAASNRRILKVVGDTRLLIRIFSMGRVGHSVDELASIGSYHEQILEAVLQGNGERAMTLVGEHIRISRQERLDELDRRDREMALTHQV